jgi:hypothetical protein
MAQSDNELFSFYHKVHKMENEYDVSSHLLMLGFEAVYQYQQTGIKDKQHWKNWLFEEYCRYEVEKLGNPQNYKPHQAEHARMMQVPADLSKEDDEDLALLKMLADGGTIRNYHRVGLMTVTVELIRFIEKTGKHLFDYVLEDLPGEMLTYKMMQLTIHRAGTN